jgi:hypothetical protein
MTTAILFLATANVFNSVWNKRIMDAEMNGGFTYEEKKATDNWDACVIGTTEFQNFEIELIDELTGLAIDNELWLYGTEFNIAVKNDDYLNAARWLVETHTRATQLSEEQYETM